jgi:hypothetical protein
MTCAFEGMVFWKKAEIVQLQHAFENRFPEAAQDLETSVERLTPSAIFPNMPEA